MPHCFVGAALGLLLAGCAAADLAVLREDAPRPPFPECEADSYDFAGEGTFRALGLDVATPVPPPTPDRPAMIWVTHDLLPFDPGPDGGPRRMTRMLCFEFPDGTGGSEWPVDAAWQPPTLAAAASGPFTLTSGLALLALAVLLGIGVSAVAFRRRR